MNSISRQEALKIIGRIRRLADGDAQLQGYFERMFSDENDERDETDILCLGVTGGYLSDLIRTCTGISVSVTGSAEELYECPCCGYKTLTERYDPKEGTGYDICPCCKWEDDGTTAVDKYSSVNRGTISDYRKKLWSDREKFHIGKWYR